jgi:hypothetical protein
MTSTVENVGGAGGSCPSFEQVDDGGRLFRSHLRLRSLRVRASARSFDERRASADKGVVRLEHFGEPSAESAVVDPNRVGSELSLSSQLVANERLQLAALSAFG